MMNLSHANAATRSPARNAAPWRLMLLIAASSAMLATATHGAELAGGATVDLAATADLADPPPQCDLWLVDTRACCGCEFTPRVRHYQCGEGWQNSSLDEFYASDDRNVVTSVMVHGNDNDIQSACEQGSKIFRHVCCGCCPATKLRYVIWAWPSDYICGTYRHDVRVKAGRIDPQAFYLARFLARLQADLPVSLVGYSYGSPIVMGSLHLLAGGKLRCRELGIPEAAHRRRFHVLLMAAAMGANSLCEGCHYGMAMKMVERLAVMRNPTDRILHHYQMLARDRRGPKALGTRGPACCKMVDDGWKRIVFYDVHECVGRHHFLKHYIASCGAMNIVRKEALLLVPLTEPSEAASARDTAETETAAEPNAEAA